VRDQADAWGENTDSPQVGSKMREVTRG